MWRQSLKLEASGSQTASNLGALATVQALGSFEGDALASSWSFSVELEFRISNFAARRIRRQKVGRSGHRGLPVPDHDHVTSHDGGVTLFLSLWYSEMICGVDWVGEHVRLTKTYWKFSSGNN